MQKAFVVVEAQIDENEQNNTVSTIATMMIVIQHE
jgi:hypothetical protein